MKDEYIYNCTIKRVVDGDTVDVDIDLGFGVWLRDRRIRLYGIDTPECRTRDKLEKAHGLLAKQAVEELLVVGQTYKLESHETGKFGRILGTIWYSETTKQSVNGYLVSNYLAVKYFGQSKEDIKQQLIELREMYKGHPIFGES